MVVSGDIWEPELSSLLLLNTMAAAVLHVGIGGGFRVEVGVVDCDGVWDPGLISSPLLKTAAAATAHVGVDGVSPCGCWVGVSIRVGVGISGGGFGVAGADFLVVGVPGVVVDVRAVGLDAWFLVSSVGLHELLIFSSNSLVSLHTLRIR